MYHLMLRLILDDFFLKAAHSVFYCHMLSRSVFVVLFGFYDSLESTCFGLGCTFFMRRNNPLFHLDCVICVTLLKTGAFNLSSYVSITNAKLLDALVTFPLPQKLFFHFICKHSSEIDLSYPIENSLNPAYLLFWIRSLL